MKHAYKSFLLENESPVKVCGDESLYALQNTSNNTVTLQGSNTATEWANLIDIPAGTTKHIQSAFAFLKANGELHVNRAQGSLSNPSFLDGNGKLVTVSSSNPLPVGGNIFNEGREVSSSNPLPVAQPDGLEVSGTATSAAVLFTTSMLNYESITVQVTSAGSSCTVTYEASEDGVNWQTTSGLTTSNIGASVNTTTSTITMILQFPRKSSNFRARVSTYGSGTVSVVGTLSKTPVAQIGLVYLGGGISPEGGGAGTSPLAIGLECRTSSKTSVSNSTLVRPIATVDGRLITRLNSIPENEWQYAAASGGITNTSDNVLTAAAGAGIKNYLTGLSVANASATASEIVITNGGATVIWRMYLAANAPIQSIKFATPLQSSTNTSLTVACITTGTQTYINAQGYKAP